MSPVAKGGQIVLEPGQVAVCVHCHAIAECGYVDTDEACIDCGAGGVIVRDVLSRGRKAIAARWGEDVARTGFTGTPNVLLAHLTALKLKPLDHLLLELIEMHRRESEEAWPSEQTLADLTDMSVSQVGRRLRGLRQRGLIEWTRSRGYAGQWGHRIYTRHGLARVCQLIAANRRADQDEWQGVSELLDELAKEATHRASARGGATAHQRPVDHTASVRGGEPQMSAPPPRTSAVDHSASVQSTTAHQCATNKRQVEAEANEPDSPYGASLALSRDDGPPDESDDEDPFAVFDVPTTSRSSRPRPSKSSPSPSRLRTPR